MEERKKQAIARLKAMAQEKMREKDRWIFHTNYNPTSTKVPGFCYVIDPESGEQVALKYSYGASTIFYDEMSENLQDHKNNPPRPLRFEQGERHFDPGSNPLELMYILLCGYNKHCLARRHQNTGELCWEFDPVKNDSIAIDKQRTITRLQSKILDMRDQDVKAAWMVLQKGKMSFEQATREDIVTIRRKMIETAKSNPKRVEKALEEETAQARFWINQAILSNYIKMDREHNALRWADTGEIIDGGKGLGDMNIIDQFSALTETSDSHRETLNKIIKMVDPSYNGGSEQSPQASGSDYLQDLIDQAMAAEKPIVTMTSKNEYVITDKETGKYGDRYATIEEFKGAIAKNPKMLAEIASRVSELVEA